MKIIYRVLVTLTLLTLLTACGEKSSSSSIGILDEISGVWRANGDGTMVSIIYADKKVRLLFGDDSLPVSLGEVDNTNKTVNMNVTLINGKPGVWTIRQIWDKEKTSFHLQLTLHDGTQDSLSFVRKISSDDLNKIANAEARARPGSIGETAKAAEAVNQAALPVQPTPENIAPSAAAAQPLVEQATVAASTPSQATWMPSFDCTKASTGPERLICSNKELSEADVTLAQAYRVALNASSDKDALKNSQIAWRKSERDACSDVQCMLTAYQNRLMQLGR